MASGGQQITEHFIRIFLLISMQVKKIIIYVYNYVWIISQSLRKSYNKIIICRKSIRGKNGPSYLKISEGGLGDSGKQGNSC